MNRRDRKQQVVRILVCTAATACLLSACGKDKPANNGVTGRPASTTVAKETQTLSNLRVKIQDITAYAGETIDYMEAIESAENMEISRSMIYIDSSMVDNHTPGIYKATYTFDYMGSTVTNSVKVTILENKNPVTETTTQEEMTTVPDLETAEATTVSSETTGENSSETETTTSTEASAETTTVVQETTVAATTAPTQATVPVSTEPITAVVEQPLPDAVITLSTGKTVTIKMTSTRYITETFTEDTYYEENGLTFLNSELKVLFNTGEVQVVETVITRVQPPQPETAAETTAAPKE